MSAGRAGAVLFDRPAIVGQRQIAQSQPTGVGESHGVTPVPRRHDAIEQVNTAVDRLEQVDRRSDPH